MLFVEKIKKAKPIKQVKQDKPVKAKKNLQLIDYQSSYFYRESKTRQRRTFWLRAMLIVFCFAATVTSIALITMSGTAIASEFSPREGRVASMDFTVEDTSSDIGLSPIYTTQSVDTIVDIQINGLIAQTTVKQVFTNPLNIKVQGKYQFPLPENASVNYLHIAIGDRVIEGKVMEKQQAKRVFKQAQKRGRKASLVQQHRPNIFSNHIANIGPNERIEVTLKYVQTMGYDKGQFSLRFPLAITPRYQPLSQQQIPSVNLDDINLNQASNINRAMLNVKLDAGVKLESIESLSHQLNISVHGKERPEYLVQVAKSSANQAFVLTWQTQESQLPQVSVFQQSIDDEYYGLVMVLPPKNESVATIDRDVIFVIDTSGSMQGQSIRQAKASLLFALNTLTEQDSFNIIAFESNSSLLFRRTQRATSQNIQLATKFIQSLQANGGTEMYQPLSQALTMRQVTREERQPHDALKQVIFITDGAVSNEQKLFELVKQTRGKRRLFTVGIGAAPNGYFMKKAAQFGGGSYIYIGNTREVEQKMSQLLHKISQPVVRNIAITSDSAITDSLAIYPKTARDLYLGEPLVFSYYSELPLVSLSVTGIDATNQQWHQDVFIPSGKNAVGVNTLWAGAKIDDLLDGLVIGHDPAHVKQAVLETSLTHQVLSPYSSFIAVEKEPQTEHQQGTEHARMDKKSLSAPQNIALVTPQTGLGWLLNLLLGLSLLALSLIYIYRLPGQIKGQSL